MPVAMGSSVPTWPALCAPKALRTRCSVPFDVSPCGLSITMMPVGIGPVQSYVGLALVGFHRAVDEAREFVGVFDLLVVDELELGRVAQGERASHLAAQESRRRD